MNLLRRIKAWLRSPRVPNTTTGVEPNDHQFFTRTHEVRTLHEHPDSPHLFVLIGAAGMGKTRWLRELQIMDSAAGYMTPLVEISSRMDDQNTFFGGICEALLPRLGPLTTDLGRLREALNQRSVEISLELVSAFFQDSIEFVAPGLKNTAASLNKVLGEALKDADLRSKIQALNTAFRNDPAHQFKSVVQLSSILGIQGRILIDGFDRASEGIQNAVHACLHDLPVGWRITLAVNDENLERNELERIIKELSLYSGKKITTKSISPLSRTEIEQWCIEIGSPPLTVELATKIETETQGRPYLVEMAFQKTEISLKAMGNEYKSQIHKLENQKAKQLIYALAILPQFGWISKKMVMLLSGSSAFAELDEIVTSLEDHLMLKRRARNGYEIRLFHDLLGRSIFQSMGEDLRSEVAQRVSKAIADPASGVDSVTAPFYNLLLAEWLPTFSDEHAAQCSAFADHLVETGKIDAGLDGLSALERGFQKRAVLTNERIEAIGYIRAKAYYFRGAFTESKNCLEKLLGAARNPHFVDAKVLLAKVLLRLGDFKASEELCNELIEHGIDDISRVALLRCKNTIERDRGEYHAALRTLDSIIFVGQQLTAIPEQMQCDIARTTARTYCFIPEFHDKAKREAELAIEIATKAGLYRELANSFLALGETFRHRGDNGEAVASYHQAITAAKMTSDRDSLFWSTISLADALLRMGETAESKRALSEIEWLVKYWGNDRPFEGAHFVFSQNVIHYLETMSARPSIPNFYITHRIAWPDQYVKSMISNPQDLPAKRF